MVDDKKKLDNYGYIYVVIDLETNRRYVGQNKGPFNPKYYGSGKIIKNYVHKYGKTRFKLKPIDVAFSKGELDELEIAWIADLDCIWPKGFNLTEGGEGSRGTTPWNKDKKCPQIGRKGKVPWNKNKTYVELLGNEQAKDLCNKFSRAKTGKPNKSKGKPNPVMSERMTVQLLSVTKDRICSLYKDGYNVLEIVKILRIRNAQRGVVERVLRENNIKLRTTAESKLLKWRFIKDKVLALHLCNRSNHSIFKELRSGGVNIRHPDTVRKIIKFYRKDTQ